MRHQLRRTFCKSPYQLRHSPRIIIPRHSTSSRFGSGSRKPTAKAITAIEVPTMPAANATCLGRTGPLPASMGATTRVVTTAMLVPIIGRRRLWRNCRRSAQGQRECLGKIFAEVAELRDGYQTAD